MKTEKNSKTWLNRSNKLVRRFTKIIKAGIIFLQDSTENKIFNCESKTFDLNFKDDFDRFGRTVTVQVSSQIKFSFNITAKNVANPKFALKNFAKDEVLKSDVENFDNNAKSQTTQEEHNCPQKGNLKLILKRNQLDDENGSSWYSTSSVKPCIENSTQTQNEECSMKRKRSRIHLKSLRNLEPPRKKFKSGASETPQETLISKFFGNDQESLIKDDLAVLPFPSRKVKLLRSPILHHVELKHHQKMWDYHPRSKTMEADSIYGPPLDSSYIDQFILSWNSSFPCENFSDENNNSIFFDNDELGEFNSQITSSSNPFSYIF